jgi:phage gp36-like protein
MRSDIEKLGMNTSLVPSTLYAYAVLKPFVKRYRFDVVASTLQIPQMEFQDDVLRQMSLCDATSS